MQKFQPKKMKKMWRTQQKVLPAGIGAQARGQRPSGGQTGTMTCCYCKKTGHMQKECQKRIAKNGVMIRAQGPPYQNNGMILRHVNGSNPGVAGQLALNCGWAVV